jgi:hypothetical protein
MTLEWFHRMGDIPGLAYQPPITVNRATLPGYDKKPRLHRLEFEGRVVESLNWGSLPSDRSDAGPGAMRSARAPVAERAWTDEQTQDPTDQLLQQLWEGLELPGEGFDYHFAIQCVHQELWRRRLNEPQSLAWFERLAWLDIRLVEAYPQAAQIESHEAEVTVAAFHGLTSVYLEEGFLHEAIDVARIAAKVGREEKGPNTLQELEARLATVHNEDAS